MQVQINNLLGRGQRINLAYEIGSLRQNYEIGFVDPWFMQHYFSLGVNVFNMKRERSFYWNRTNTVYVDANNVPIASVPLATPVVENDLYDEISRGFGLTLGKRFKEIFNSGIGYSYEDIRVNNLTERFKTEDISDPLNGGKLFRNISDEIANSTDRGLVKTSAISLSLSRDTRDNIFDATTGSNQILNYKVAGGWLQGDNNFQKLTLETAWFFPSFWKFVWGLHGMFGVVNTYGSTVDVPVYERFFLGGAETLRGYEYSGQVGEVSGGKFVTLLNLEYSFPIIREKRQTVLKGAFFYDAGNTWATTKLGHNDYALKQDVGFGLRFTIPMFPIRLDWGYGLNHREGERLSQFFFSIGPVF
jgi:outer membrane protein insertion porin family